MSQQLADDFHVHPLLKEERRERMTEIVEADAGKRGAGKEWPKRSAQHTALLKGTADGIGKHEVLVVPHTPQAQPLDGLASPTTGWRSTQSAGVDCDSLARGVTAGCDSLTLAGGRH